VQACLTFFRELAKCTGPLVRRSSDDDDDDAPRGQHPLPVDTLYHKKPTRSVSHLCRVLSYMVFA
jgi:hypothetical protein